MRFYIAYLAPYYAYTPALAVAAAKLRAHHRQEHNVANQKFQSHMRRIQDKLRRRRRNN